MIGGPNLTTAIQDLTRSIEGLGDAFDLDLGDALEDLLRPMKGLVRVKATDADKHKRLIPRLMERGFSETEARALVARIDNPKIRKRIEDALD